MRDFRASLSAWWSFRGSGLGTMAFLAGRFANLPLGALDAELLAFRGRVLSLGCGHGLAERYMSFVNPSVTVEGLELDAGRVAAAARSQDRAPRVRVRVQDVTHLEGGEGYDGALVMDVLHHVPKSEHARIAAALFAALRPGAQCLVKDIATTPRWKHAFNRLHDRVVTGVWVTDARSPDDMCDVFTSAGFVARDVRRLAKSSPYPHYLLALERPPNE